MEARGSSIPHSLLAEGHQPMPGPAMHASAATASHASLCESQPCTPTLAPAMHSTEESVSPRSMAATQGTDWGERVWATPPGWPTGGEINGRMFPAPQIHSLSGLPGWPGRHIFRIPEVPEPGPSLDWAAASSLTVPCYATSHLSLVTSSRGHVAVLVGSMPPPADGAHRYRVEAPPDQLPLLLTQLREVYDVSIRALSFQGLLHLAALLFPGEGWEDFSPGPAFLPSGQVTSHKPHVTSHRARGAGARGRAAGGRAPGAEEKRERLCLPENGKGKSLPEKVALHRASEAQVRGGRGVGCSDDEAMGDFVRGWHCSSWGSPLRRHRRQDSPRQCTAPPAPAKTAAPQRSTASSPTSGSARAATPAAAQGPRSAHAPKPATAALPPTPVPSSPPIHPRTVLSVRKVPPAPATAAEPPAVVGPGSPNEALMQGLAEGEAFCARVAQAADRIQYMMDGRGRGKEPGRIGASMVSLRALRSCVRLEIDVQMAPALQREWVLFSLDAPGAPPGNLPTFSLDAPGVPAGDPPAAVWDQGGASFGVESAAAADVEGGWTQVGAAAHAAWQQAGITVETQVPAKGRCAQDSVGKSPSTGTQLKKRERAFEAGSTSNGEPTSTTDVQPAPPSTPAETPATDPAAQGYTAGSLEISAFLERCKRPFLGPPALSIGLPPVYPPQAQLPQVHPPQVYPPRQYAPLLYLPLSSTVELCHELESGQMLLLVRDPGSGAVQVLVDGRAVQEVCPGCTAAAFHEPSRLLALHFCQSHHVELHRFSEDFSWVEFTGATFPVCEPWGGPVTVSEHWGGPVTVSEHWGGPVTVSEHWGGPVTASGRAGAVSWMGFAETEMEGGLGGEIQGLDSHIDGMAQHETVLFGPQLHLIVAERDSLAVLTFPVGEAVPACLNPRALSLGPCKVGKGVVVSPDGTHLMLLAAPQPAVPAKRREAQVVPKTEALRCMKESSTKRQPLFLLVVCLVTMTEVKELPLPLCHGSLSDWDIGISYNQEGALNIVLLQLSTGKLSSIPVVSQPQATRPNLESHNTAEPRGGAYRRRIVM